MIVNIINCVKTPECLLNIWPTHIHVIIYGIILGVSAIGIVNNLTCIYIFTTCKSMKNSFFHLMKVKQKFPQCLISVTEFKFYSRCIHSIVFWSISTILLYLLGFFFPEQANLHSRWNGLVRY